MSLPTYSTYKDSGVSWLGMVPAHWELKPIKSLARGAGTLFIDGDWIESSNISDDGIRYITTGNVGAGAYREQGSGYISEATFQALNCTEVFSGDILISRLNAPIGRACVVPDLGARIVTSVDNVIVRPSEKVERRFLVFRLSSPDYFHETGNIASGATMQRISRSELGNIRIAFPPRVEQIAIADFLDHETSKIDALVAEQEKLLGLLAEKRQATISHATTRGLNPDVPMRDSGVAWLGEVPAHWRVMPVRYVAKIGNGSTPNRDNPEYWTEGTYPWLNSSVVNQDIVLESEQFVTASALRECHLPIIEPPAVLLGITGQGRTRGMAATLMVEATINQHVAYIKPDETTIRVEFLRRIFDMAYQHLRTESDGGGSTKGAITCEQVGRLSIPIPEVEEQLDISAFLAAETMKLDALKSEAERAIGLLKERRSALIAAAVTGKIDVRERSLELEAAA